MTRSKLWISLILASILVISQVAEVIAAPPLEDAYPIIGAVQRITLETDLNTGMVTVLVEVMDENSGSQTFRIGQETAIELGLVVLDEDGNLFINEDALGLEIEVDSVAVIPNETEAQHPVGSALAAFFSDSDVAGLDYDTIMGAHETGYGFGLIAQALWLTQKLGGDAEDFELILQAKKDGDYSNFVFEDGTSPTNWAQFRRAVMGEDRKGNLGIIMSTQNKDDTSDSNANNGTSVDKNNGNNDKGNNKDKDKDKSNNGKDNSQGKKP